MVENLSVFYRGGLIAVSNFSFSIPSVVALIGAIGSGKSSVLRAIGGIAEYEGEIKFAGKNIAVIPIRDRDFSYASFDSPLFGSKTVEFNLGYGLKIRKMPKDYIQNTTRKIAEEFGICNLLSQKAKSLSFFERRLVVLARAFMRSSQLYLFNQLSFGLNEEETGFLVEKVATAYAKTKALLLIASSDYAFVTAFSRQLEKLLGKGIGKMIMVSGGKKICEGDEQFYKNTPPDIQSALFTANNLILVEAKIEIKCNNIVSISFGNNSVSFSIEYQSQEFQFQERQSQGHQSEECQSQKYQPQESQHQERQSLEYQSCGGIEYLSNGEVIVGIEAEDIIQNEDKRVSYKPDLERLITDGSAQIKRAFIFHKHSKKLLFSLKNSLFD